MKLLLAVLAAAAFELSLANAQVPVNSYTRNDGTQVPFHHRSKPDSNPYNNYSFPGNTTRIQGVWLRVIPIPTFSAIRTAFGSQDTYNGLGSPYRSKRR